MKKTAILFVIFLVSSMITFASLEREDWGQAIVSGVLSIWMAHELFKNEKQTNQNN